MQLDLLGRASLPYSRFQCTATHSSQLPYLAKCNTCACRYITGDELASVSSYMRSRLTADKCNAALDELAGLAEVGGWVGGRVSAPCKAGE